MLMENKLNKDTLLNYAKIKFNKSKLLLKQNHQMKKLIFLEFVVFLILLVSFVSSVGVASPVWQGNPLRISPGETRTVNLELQNMVGDEDVTIRAALKRGFEIASTKEKDYFVKAGTKDTLVPVIVSIPEDIQVDTTYQVTVSFLTVTPGSSGGVALGTGIDTTFDVLVVELPVALAPEKPKLEIFSIIAVVIILTAIILIVWFFLRRKKHSRIKK